MLIENQLERTDHGHLGQLLTYAAGLDAVTIVWIASRFTDEHRAVLDWLNGITDSQIDFFGLEIELWRIDDSPLAPRFNVVSQPNDWTKQIKQAATSAQDAVQSEAQQAHPRLLGAVRPLSRQPWEFPRILYAASSKWQGLLGRTLGFRDRRGE